MKYYLKVFFISLSIFTILLICVAAIYIKNYSYVEEYNSNWANEFVDNEDISAEFISDIIEKNRINVLVVGLEEVRSDTTFVISYNAKLKNAHIISIPRDTYYFREDFQFSQNNKINSIYQVKGIEGLKDKIEEILKIPINNYIIIDYEAFKVAVDAVEGVEINVPFHMKYDDIKDSPPLRIDIKPGKQTLDGENALKFLRFRKGNPGYESYKHGDLERIKVHQNFIKELLKKVLGMDLIKVVKKVFPYINTDFTIVQASSIAMNAIGIDINDINFYTLPGADRYENKISFYFYDEEEVSKLIKNIYMR